MKDNSCKDMDGLFFDSAMEPFDEDWSFTPPGASVAEPITLPQWSRWAMNLVKHTDRADICVASDPLFEGLTEEDLRWWNGDTFLAHDYLALDTLREGDQILSRK